MAGLWADGWFYISSAGLLVSGVLFFFLLSQYRAAAEAADSHEAEPEPQAEAPATPVRSVYIPDEPAPSPKIASVAVEKPEAKAPAAEAPKAEAARVEVERRRENITGGLSPAVVYLQNIQTHLYELHGELRSLSQRVDSITSRDEALIERLSELASAVAEIRASAPPAAAVSAEAPKRAKKIEAPEPKAAPIELTVEARSEPKAEAKPAPKPEPAPEAKPEPKAEAKPEPKAEAKPEPKAEAKKVPVPDETIRLELGAVVGVPSSAAATASPLPAVEAEPDEKPRRGPVWPV